MRTAWTIVVAALATFVVGGPVTAGLIAQDNFDYADGLLNGNNGGIGWDTAWTSDEINGEFNVVSNQAIYKGNGSGAIDRTPRGLTSAIALGLSDKLTIDFDLIIGSGAGDVNGGRGIGVNFVDSSSGDILFTIGKKLNGVIGIWSNGISGATSTLLGTVVDDSSPDVGVYPLTTTLTSNGADTFISTTDGLTTADYTFVGEQFSIDTVELTGYHALTTSNGVDTLSIDLVTIPEPSTIALLGLAALGFTVLRRR